MTIKNQENYIILFQRDKIRPKYSATVLGKMTKFNNNW